MPKGNGGQGRRKQTRQIRAYEVIHNIHGNLLLFVIYKECILGIMISEYCWVLKERVSKCRINIILTLKARKNNPVVPSLTCGVCAADEGSGIPVEPDAFTTSVTMDARRVRQRSLLLHAAGDSSAHTRVRIEATDTMDVRAVSDP
jgi:hypothetical protein